MAAGGGTEARREGGRPQDRPIFELIRQIFRIRWYSLFTCLFIIHYLYLFFYYTLIFFITTFHSHYSILSILNCKPLKLGLHCSSVKVHFTKYSLTMTKHFCNQPPDLLITFGIKNLKKAWLIFANTLLTRLRLAALLG